MAQFKCRFDRTIEDTKQKKHDFRLQNMCEYFEENEVLNDVK